MTSRRILVLSFLGAFGLSVILLTCVSPNLAADKAKKSDAGANKAGAAAKKDADDTKSDDPADGDDDAPKKIVKTDAEWKKQLNALQFKVTRKKGTERPGTGIYEHTKKDGIYRCICCGQPLFDSKTKFDSGTGWPSFFQTLNDKAVNYIDDTSDGELRTEVECSRCDAHLGHVFSDGPPPTGRRYCMNSASLKLVTRDAAEKEAKAKESKSKSASGEKSAKSKDDVDKKDDKK